MLSVILKLIDPVSLCCICVELIFFLKIVFILITIFLLLAINFTVSYLFNLPVT